MTASPLRVKRHLLLPLGCLALIAGLAWAGGLPDLPPPRPLPLSRAERRAEQQKRTIDPETLGPGAAEVPVVRLLDHLKTARRQHPDLVAAYRDLGRARGAPSAHWRHYIDPWSKLPAALRPLRVQMTFTDFNVRGYARPAGASANRPGPARRLQFGKDRRMNRTPGVNETRLSLFAPVPAAITFRVDVPEKAFLTFGTGVPLGGPRGAVVFLVQVQKGSAEPQEVARFTVDRTARHQWQDRRVDLSRFGGEEVQLTLRTTGPPSAHAFFANPILWKPRTARRGKNILFILIDTLRADAVHSVAGSAPVTPNLDQLAQRGVVFTWCQATASWTRSSLLTMFTGEHAALFHWRLNSNFFLTRALRRQLYARWPRMLTWHLKKQRYLTEAIGNNFFLPGYTPIGFDRGYDRVTDIRAEWHDSPAITRGAIRFLQQNRRRPFFLYLHYDGPHSPYRVPKGYRVSGARPPGGPKDVHWELYLGETRWADENVGPVLHELRRLGLQKNTVVVVTGDHGEVFHRAHDVLYGKNHRTLHHHGYSLFQEVLHVPLILAAPGTIPAGRRISTPVSQLDLVPTLLDLAGLPPMEGHRGRSLAPAIRKGTPVPKRPMFATARWLYAVRDGRWKYLHRFGPTRKFRRPHEPDRVIYSAGDLYDLQTDPHETRNLARQHPDKVRRLRKLLAPFIAPLGRTQLAVSGPRKATAPSFGGRGLQIHLRLWGGRGPHKLTGKLSCDGTVVVRRLAGPTSRATYVARDRVSVVLENRDGRPAEAALEFVGCLASTIRLDLRLDGRALGRHQIATGPFGLKLLRDPRRLPMARLAALISHRPPPRLPSRLPAVHLWLGAGSDTPIDLDAKAGAAARLANQMLRNAGYAKGPRSPRPEKRPQPRPAPLPDDGR